uniref:Uncharacterized protein n=1 Tax=Eptatretus burgeri TaxID=7764 RepID=A0A8C4NBY3_EPTBU
MLRSHGILFFFQMPLPEAKKRRNGAGKSVVDPCVNSRASSACLTPRKKATALDCHVPSLCSASRVHEEGASLAQLYTVYEGQDGAGGVQTRGLLDALARNENGDHRQALDNDQNEQDQRQNKVGEDRYKGISKRLVVVNTKVNLLVTVPCCYLRHERWTEVVFLPTVCLSFCEISESRISQNVMDRL